MRSQLAPHKAAPPGRATNRASHPKWLLWGFAVVALGVGVGTDLRPELGTQLFYVFIASLLLVIYLPRLKRSGSARSPLSARSVGRSALTMVLSRIALFALVLGFAVARFALRISDVPMPATVASALIVVTMPLWLRMFNRTPVRHG